MGRQKDFEDLDDDDDDDYRQPQRSRTNGRRESGTDAPGVIGLVLGVVAIICLLMGCFTCGLTYYAAAPLALVGGICSFFGRGNMKVAGLVLNLLTLIPAIIILGMFVAGVGMAAIAPKK